MSKEAFLLHLHGVARKHGFKRQSGGLARPSDGCVVLVNVQKSSGRPLVAVNLGVYLVELGRLEYDREHGAPWKPDITECHWRDRLHVGGGSESWWKVDDPDVVEASARDAGEQLERAIPDLERLSRAGGLVGEWLAGRCPGLTDAQRERYLELLGK
jgi:hypothetical protein